MFPIAVDERDPEKRKPSVLGSAVRKCKSISNELCYNAGHKSFEKSPNVGDIPEGESKHSNFFHRKFSPLKKLNFA